MAVDESLALSARSQSGITLRFYQWDQPTLSLGYFQTVADRHQHHASAQCVTVRRTTGGGAIMHDHDLTYSLVVPRSATWAKHPETLYHLIHEGWIEVLADLKVEAQLCVQPPKRPISEEPFLCFSRRTDGDLVCKQAKIGGSAQRRHKDILLQHGSLLLGRSRYAPELDGIADLAGWILSPEELIRQAILCFEGRLKLKFFEQQLTDDELEAAERIEAGKFRTAKWTEKR